MSRSRARLAAAVTAALLTTAGLVLVAPAAVAAGPTATFTKTSDWGTGWEGNYRIANPGPTTITSWTVEFDLPSGHRITSLWDATWSQSGTRVTVRNASWNGTIGVGGSTSFGFGVAYSGAYGAPTNCRLNGAPCDGSGGPGPDTTPPSVPGGLRSTGVTSSSVSLAWTASTDNVGVTGYDVYRGTTRVSTVTGTSATVTGLAASTAYSFSVAARDAAGNVSARSAAISVTTSSGTTPPPGAYKKIGYFAQWGIYGRAFTVKSVDTLGMASKLTHINYAFGNVSQDGRCFMVNQLGQGDAYADYQRSFDAASSVDGVADTWDQRLKGNFNQLKELKAKHPNLKVLISLGGWTWSKYFSNAALTAASRQAFVASCIDLYLKGNLPQLGGDPAGGPGAAFGVFDGIDIDWEWPASSGDVGNVIRPEDKQNFTLLLQEFRRQLDAYGASVGRRYDLSAFLPADPAKITAGIEVPGVFSALDWATVQGYDFHGAWEATTNHQSNLYAAAGDPSPVDFSVDLAVSTYTSRGAPARELVVGVPFYGRGWTGVPATNNGLFQPGRAATGTWEAGIEDYKVLKNRPGTRYRDAAAGALWLYDGTNWWSYDDPQLIAQKAAYVKSRGLGGLMAWELDGDDGTLTAAVDSGLR
ncbi:MAG TPA: glycoside hydrolase family 18 chitinase [Mycobacteriales bacterium]|nr:glycoside hydrolase family 18 chitinase [Mycobacteriales bacterium]